MSGRLIILGKKGYCPWNSDNLSRIRRDQQEHREAQEREQEKQADRASILRLATLKKKGNDEESVHERFNLFESEEKACLDRVKEVQGSRSEIDERKNNERKIPNNNKKNHKEPHCQSHRFGGRCFTKYGRKKAFYLESSSIEKPLGAREVLRHQEMDPMREFHEGKEAEKGKKKVQSKRSHLEVEGLDGERKQRSSKRYRSGGNSSFERDDAYTKGTKGKHKKKKRHRRQESNPDSHRKSTGAKSGNLSDKSFIHTDSIEELRRRRAEREHQERQRQDAILKTAKALR